jgi:Mg2+-importing ATPase
VIVIVMVVLSVTLDFVQEMRAENTVEALRRTVAVRVQVRRNGVEVSEPVDQLVPGDVIRLAAGDLVPADCRLLEARDLFVNQSMLTGEPYPAEKRVDAPTTPAQGPGEALNTVFMGTSVISGSAVAVICRTGDATAFGQCFFQFVHNTRQRGKALLGALVNGPVHYWMLLANCEMRLQV